ncbi:MAG: hypothetical protein Q4E69_00740 [Bacilli bacterium]|nr:hypothetical protein [Bacilli bacterium]
MSINKKQLDLLGYVENVLVIVEGEEFSIKNVRLYKSFSEDYDKDLMIVANDKYFERLYTDLRRDGLDFDTIPAYLDEDGRINCYRIDSEFDFFDDEAKGIIFTYGVSPDKKGEKFLDVLNKEYVKENLNYLDKAMSLLDFYNTEDSLKKIETNSSLLTNTNTNDFTKKMVKTLNRM